MYKTSGGSLWSDSSISDESVSRKDCGGSLCLSWGKAECLLICNNLQTKLYLHSYTELCKLSLYLNIYYSMSQIIIGQKSVPTTKNVLSFQLTGKIK